MATRTKSRVNFLTFAHDGGAVAKYCFWYTKKSGEAGAYFVLAKPGPKGRHDHSWLRWELAEGLGLTEGLTKPTKSDKAKHGDLKVEANEFFDEVKEAPEPKTKSSKARSKAAKVEDLELSPEQLKALILHLSAKLEV